MASNAIILNNKLNAVRILVNEDYRNECKDNENENY